MWILTFIRSRLIFQAAALEGGIGQARANGRRFFTVKSVHQALAISGCLRSSSFLRPMSAVRRMWPATGSVQDNYLDMASCGLLFHGLFLENSAQFFWTAKRFGRPSPGVLSCP